MTVKSLAKFLGICYAFLMDDITLPRESMSDDDDPFLIRPIKTEDEDSDDSSTSSGSGNGGNASGGAGNGSTTGVISAPASSAIEAGNHVSIQFSKFVQLVANHGYWDVVEKNAEEKVILSGDLLTDLANAEDRSKEKRLPLIFMAGLLIGIVLTYIILK